MYVLRYFAMVVLFGATILAYGSDLSAFTPEQNSALALMAHASKGDTNALQQLKREADGGNETAQNSLGVMYAYGQGVPQDYAQAAQWYRKAANQGLAGAQFLLGALYEHGQGVPQRYIQAAQWYRKAANQGFHPAQNNLGLLYAKGQGVPKDYARALKWCLIAQAKGNKSADRGVQVLEEHLATPAQIVQAKKMAGEWWSAHSPRNREKE